MSNEEQPKRKPLMTWTEILVVLTIIGMVAALLLPAHHSHCPSRSQQLQCQNRMKQLCLALFHYHKEHQSFPPVYTVDEEGKPLHSWRVLVLPYLKAENIHHQIRLDEPWDSEYNRQFHDQMPDVFACPTASLKKGETNYMALYAVKCFSNPSKLETNILLVETATGTCWMSPVDVSVEDMPHVCNYHSDGGHIAIDGTVEYVKANEVLSAKRKIQNAE